MGLVVLPSVDLREGRVVRLKQGDYGRQVTYNVDPVETARSFASAGAKWMHIVDLDGAKAGHPVQAELIGRMIEASGMHVEVGGGIRSTEDIRRFLAAGAAQVVVGTRAMEDWSWFERVAREGEFSGRIVLALDARDGVVATRGWMASSGRLATEVAADVSDWPLAAILYTDVSKDGMLQGPNFEQTRKVAEAGRVPVIASGGVGTIEHIRQLAAMPVWGVIVGRSLYEGTVELHEALRVAEAAGR